MVEVTEVCDIDEVFLRVMSYLVMDPAEGEIEL